MLRLETLQTAIALRLALLTAARQGDPRPRVALAPQPPAANVRQDCRPPSGELLKGIESKWGSLDKFIGEFNTKTAAVQVGRKLCGPCRQQQPAAGTQTRTNPLGREATPPLLAELRLGRGDPNLPPPLCPTNDDRARAGAGWATTRPPAPWTSPHAPTRTRWPRR